MDGKGFVLETRENLYGETILMERTDRFQYQQEVLVLKSSVLEMFDWENRDGTVHSRLEMRETSTEDSPKTMVNTLNI